MDKVDFEVWFKQALHCKVRFIQKRLIGLRVSKVSDFKTMLQNNNEVDVVQLRPKCEK